MSPSSGSRGLQSRSIVDAVLEHFRTDPEARAAYESAKAELRAEQERKRKPKTKSAKGKRKSR